MFGDTLLVGGITYKKINQDGYSSEYRYGDNLVETGLKIRHNSRVDKTRGNIRVDRHNIEITGRVFATVAGKPDVIRKAYAVFEIDYNDAPVAALGFLNDVVEFCTDANVTKLLAWES